MTTKLNSIFFVLAMFLTNGIFAQNAINNSTSLHPKTAQFALEVYQDVVEYQTPEHLSIYSQNLSQVSISDMGSLATNYETLQTVGLKNKYNPSLTYDQEGFDINNFNPLKYHFDFYSSEIQSFRVGTTSYIVTITPLSN